MSPPALDRVVKTCLEKDPDERFQTAHDLKLQLQWIGEGGSQAGVPAPVAAHRKIRERAAWAAAGAFLILAGVAAAAYWQLARQPERAVRAYILPPEKSSFRTNGPGMGPVIVSPDGRLLVFSAASSDGVRLWVRPLDSLSAQPLTGTENAVYPFWSWDSRNIGFFADGKLKRIAVSGGPPQSLCDAPSGRGGSWNRDGVILFAPDVASPIFRVPQAGGVPEPVTKLNVARQENSNRWPDFLPDGRHFIFFGRSNDPAQNGTYLGSLDGAEPKFLLKGGSTAAVYAPPGFLLFVREGTLLAQGFDATKGQLSGEPLPVAERVEMNESTQRASFGVSQNGVIAFHAGGSLGDNSILTWYDRTGKLLETVASPGVFVRPRLSPDGLKVATTLVDLWVLDLRRGVKSRLTFGPGPTTEAVWSPDGSRIAYSAVRQGFSRVYARSADGSGNEETLLEAEAMQYPRSWSADGRFLAIERLPQGKSTIEIWILPMFGERKAFPFLQDSFNEDEPAFSPNGKWLAYRSNESGREEVFVTRFPEKSGKWQVSSGGGSLPHWRADGKELFYIGSDGKLMTAAVEEKNGSPVFSTGQALFALPSAFTAGAAAYDVSRDGRRILIPKLMESANPEPITLIVNWTAEMGQK
jgi:Tol biopolymer transport system component